MLCEKKGCNGKLRLESKKNKNKKIYQKVTLNYNLYFEVRLKLELKRIHARI